MGLNCEGLARLSSEIFYISTWVFPGSLVADFVPKAELRMDKAPRVPTLSWLTSSYYILG